MITTVPGGGTWSSAVILADMDGDDDMELVHPNAAYHHDGTVLYSQNAIGSGRHAIADFDDDGEPEVVIGESSGGLSMLEHNGDVKFSGLQPVGGFDYSRPPAVHDIDGDGVPNFMNSTGGTFAVYEPDGTLVWSRPVDDGSGSAGSTAFDFLGDGGAEAMYGDEEYIWAFDSDGTPKVQQERSSATVIEYPVVSDVDNDGSAEIIVPSSHYFVFGDEPNPYPVVQVFRDAEDRWIQARRIWNQHTYHVTNVREDGTIPMVESKHWQGLNTFRTNAQIENGGVCNPAG
jgi:outer membrane protein assembly factor BamB